MDAPQIGVRDIEAMQNRGRLSTECAFGQSSRHGIHTPAVLDERIQILPRAPSDKTALVHLEDRPDTNAMP